MGAPIVNASSQYNLNGNRVLASNGSNLFIGLSAGTATTTATSNSFVGVGAGANTTSGPSNSFMGNLAGNVNVGGGNNSYFGNSAGQNARGSYNSYFGQSAGLGSGTPTGGHNTAIGVSAGQQLQNGANNSFLGLNAGANTTDGVNNVMIGMNAGLANVIGNYNVMVGQGSGLSGSSLSSATLLGSSTDASAGILNATALGSQAMVTQANSLVLGSINQVNGATASTNVGIGSTAPRTVLYVVGKGPGTLGPIVTVFNSGLGAGSAAAVDLGGYEPQPGDAPASRIESIDDGNFSSNLVFFTKQPGANNSPLVEGLRVTNNAFVKPHLSSAGSSLVCTNAAGELSPCSSSIRYKDDIQNFRGGLDLIARLRPVSFRWKDGGKRDVGLVAEEVEKAAPLLTVYDDKGQVEGVKYDHLSVLLINAIKEQQVQLDEARRENGLLRERLERLERILQK